MTETQTHRTRLTENPLRKRRKKAAPARKGGGRLIKSRARAGKLKEIVKEMKETTVVADRIVAVVNEQKPKSSAQKKHTIAVSKAPSKARKLKSPGTTAGR
jgi:hypothetical protein